MFQKASLYPLFAILFWAGNVVVSKMASHNISPVAITFYRLVLALAVMSTFVLIPVWKNRHTIKLYWKQLVLGGFLSVSLFQFLSYQAAVTTTATNMAIVTALIPLLTMILSSLILKDKISYGMLFGGALSFYGILYLLSHGSILNIWDQGVHLGDGLMLVAAFGYALYGVLLKHWKMPIPAWQSNFVQSSFAILYVLPFFIFLPAADMQLNQTTIPLILYASIFSSILLSYFWIEGVRHLGPNRNSIFMNLLPLFTALIAVVLLGEHLQAFHYLGGSLTLIGILIAQTIQKPIQFKAHSSRVVD
ncbi:MULTISPECIES: DMT family transporter [Acinetobacter]|uniref:DMT family transporter n=1 Tax=Acinetobacter TaxID=469 RepID=UPI000C3ADCD2|nr:MULTISPECIES: DMT family transporter [Acinetobacter]MBT49677.1 EamA family transporter [Acinetobacter sp.]HIQ33649.1 DMT family transporter [Acinetobacter venetianus]HJP48859.1 DMT family transporter [Acinetobacter venetianus]